MFLICYFFFKQKTAYEMRISDWSSDVCSSDLIRLPVPEEQIGPCFNARTAGFMESWACIWCKPGETGSHGSAKDAGRLRPGRSAPHQRDRRGGHSDRKSVV